MSLAGIIEGLRSKASERTSEAAAEVRISQAFSESLSRIHEGTPKQAILAAVQAKKELARWAGLNVNELNSVQKEEYMSRKELRAGIEEINHKSMRSLCRKFVKEEKEIEALLQSESGTLINITRRLRWMADALNAIERIATKLSHGENTEKERRTFERELSAARAELRSALFYLKKHVVRLRRISGIENKELKLVPSAA